MWCRARKLNCSSSFVHQDHSGKKLNACMAFLVSDPSNVHSWFLNANPKSVSVHAPQNKANPPPSFTLVASPFKSSPNPMHLRSHWWPRHLNPVQIQFKFVSVNAPSPLVIYSDYILFYASFKTIFSKLPSTNRVQNRYNHRLDSKYFIHDVTCSLPQKTLSLTCAPWQYEKPLSHISHLYQVYNYLKNHY